MDGWMDRILNVVDSLASCIPWCSISFIPSFLHTFLHSLARSFTHSFIRSFIHSFMPSFLHSTFCSDYVRPSCAPAFKGLKLPPNGTKSQNNNNEFGPEKAEGMEASFSLIHPQVCFTDWKQASWEVVCICCHVLLCHCVYVVVILYSGSIFLMPSWAWEHPCLVTYRLDRGWQLSNWRCGTRKMTFTDSPISHDISYSHDMR